MGTRFSTSSDDPDTQPSGEGLGNLLYGRFSDLTVDSVEVVRDPRERERY